MKIRRYDQLNEGVKLMDYNETFEKFIIGQTIKGYVSLPPYGQKISLDVAERYFGDGVILANGYKILYYGGGCSGEDCNTTFIVDPEDHLVARNDW